MTVAMATVLLMHTTVAMATVLLMHTTVAMATVLLMHTTVAMATVLLMHTIFIQCWTGWPLVREKSGKFDFSSRSEKSQGILQIGQGIFKYQESQGRVREFHNLG